MRRLGWVLVATVLLAAGCTSGSGGDPSPRPTTTPDATTFESLDIADWSQASDLEWPDAPDRPEPLASTRYEQMVTTLEAWATRAALDPTVRASDDPLAAVTDELPAVPAAALRDIAGAAVSPNLAASNVLGPGLDVVGTRVSAAWDLSVRDGDDGRIFVQLQLQTRTAYEVRGADGASHVIGVLRVQGLAADPDAGDGFGVTAGWQEYGAADCALALQDVLVPGGDVEDERRDLATFVRVGSSQAFEMPPVSASDRVDQEYLDRCRDGAV